MAIFRYYPGFILNILNGLYKKDLYVDHVFIGPVNIINSCVFIVKDKDIFIKTLSNTLFDKDKDKDKGKCSINQGPQKFRGQINSSFNFLSILDKHFRDSLYYHHKFYHNKTSHNYYITRSDQNLNKVINLLDRRKFSFDCFHCNLGKIR